MKDLSIISSLIYVVLTAIYFIFGKDDSCIWSAYYFVNTGLYIVLLLFDKIGKSSIKKASFIITAIAFQVLLIGFELYLVLWCSEEYFGLVNSWFWSTVWFIVAIIFVLTYKILNRWVNG